MRAENFPRSTTKLFEARYPRLYQAIFGRRFLVPQYRIADYENQDVLNQPMNDWFRAAVGGQIDFRNDLMRMRLVNYALALCYNRPTLYCERELAEALQRTDLPSDLTVADLNFKWPQLRIILPLNLLTTNRQGQLCSVTYLDMCLVNAAGVDRINLPEPIRAELHALPQATELPLVENQLTQT